MREKDERKTARERQRKTQRKTQRNTDRERPETGAGSTPLPPMLPPQPCQKPGVTSSRRPSKRKRGKERERQ